MPFKAEEIKIWKRERERRGGAEKREEEGKKRRRRWKERERMEAGESRGD